VEAFLLGGGFVEGDLCGVAEALFAHFDSDFGTIEVKNKADRCRGVQVERGTRRVKSNRGASGI
jgi:hypothetical protein